MKTITEPEEIMHFISNREESYETCNRLASYQWTTFSRKNWERTILYMEKNNLLFSDKKSLL